ncbi:MAG: purine-binding chemotaxis protein CheW [Syntrophomonadaceae bacterium]|jgi:purine-binding chemotaxis protein CheW|nr:purine-binding chemotaxis protein CheW [Syntrophomonadaceae bacterium]
MGSSQYVIFSLGEEEYGLNISYAQEIIRVPEQITKLPNMPAFIDGVFNLRGKVIPIIDLKKRFDFAQNERNADNRLLVIDLGNMLLGTIVDDVSEVLMVDDTSIENLYSEIASIGQNCIQGICNMGDRLILLLDALKLKEEVFQNN